MSQFMIPTIRVLIAYMTPTGWRNMPGDFPSLPATGDVLRVADQDTGSLIEIRVTGRRFERPDAANESSVSILCEMLHEGGDQGSQRPTSRGLYAAR
ncbi:hypothetical protein MOP88_04145 [Sphingomonas sp. WKB10]|nr:hypothetical protein [Sphingomonas sp. WKB10]